MGQEELKKFIARNGEKYKERRIVVYGTGLNAQKLIQAFPELNIIGVMDRDRNDGYFFGKKILNEVEIVSLNIDVIVIAAQISAMIQIYKRICKFCIAQNIQLLDKYGNDLREIFAKVAKQNANLFYRTKEQILAEIDTHDAISFDIFDTLVMRKTLFPEDVFAIVGEKAKRQGVAITNFPQIRIQTEQGLLQKCPEKHSFSIYEIYEEIARNINLTQAERTFICNLEIETEKELLLPREEMVSVFEYAVKKGKVVCLISDMYLPARILEDILSKLGIKGYKEILVSCDVRNTKYKTLYQIYKEKYPVSSYLHIGDNEEADGLCAAVFDMDFFLIKKAADILKLSTYMEIDDMLGSLNERSMVGLIVAKVFNSPFIVNETWAKPVVKKIYDAGYLFFAPIITKLIFWLIQEIQENRYTDILFSARDGYLIKKLSREAKKSLRLEELPDGIYFDASRIVCGRACIEDLKDIQWIMSPPFSCSGRQLLVDRFSLTEQEASDVYEESYDSVYDYVKAHQQKIYQKSEELRKNYLKYMKRIGLMENGKYAFFDFVSCGTCQYFLGRIVPFRLEGLYCGSYNPVSGELRDIPMKAMYQNPDYNKKETCFFANYLLYESFITSFEGTLIDISKDGCPIKSPEQPDCITKQYIRKLQQGVQSFFTEFLKMYVSGEEIHLAVVDKLFEFMNRKYTFEECVEFDSIQLKDDFGLNMLEISRMV